MYLLRLRVEMVETMATVETAVHHLMVELRPRQRRQGQQPPQRGLPPLPTMQAMSTAKTLSLVSLALLPSLDGSLFKMSQMSSDFSFGSSFFVCD
jgi:hypothetical protein